MDYCSLNYGTYTFSMSSMVASIFTDDPRHCCEVIESIAIEPLCYLYFNDKFPQSDSKRVSFRRNRMDPLSSVEV
jgi:hypothetical protein